MFIYGPFAVWVNRSGIVCGRLSPLLEILESEIITTMGLLGVSRSDQLKPAYLCKTPPLGLAHEMSAFPHMPGGRLT